MDASTKFRIALVLVSATLSVVTAVLAAHGFVFSPLDDPIGVGPH